MIETTTSMTGVRDPLQPDEIDLDLAALFEAVRSALRQDRVSAERALYTVERRVVERLSSVRSLADAVADANVRGVLLLDAQHDLARSLEEQNRELAEQNRRIEERRLELETQLRSLADANVSAVVWMEESEARLAEIETARDELLARNRRLSERARTLQGEALSLADSNAEAVVLMAEREAELERLAAHLRQARDDSVELAQAAFVDPLTGLFNHRYLREQMLFEVARARRYGRALSLLFVDADDFKSINDTHGHAAGDEVLRRLATLISGAVRAADVPVRLEGEAFAARYGGEEFVVLLPETGLAGAARAAERVRRQIELTEMPWGTTQPLGRVTVSIGVAALEEDDTAETFIQRADRALYDAKSQGRNRVIVAPRPSDQP